MDKVELITGFYLLSATLLTDGHHINAQEEALGLGEYNFQVNHNQWKKVQLAPCNNCSFYIEPSTPVRVKFDDGREFQRLPTARDFRLPNGKVINTSVIKIDGKKHIPVDSFGTMTTPFLYLRAEAGTASVHFSVRQNSGGTGGNQEQQSSNTLGGWFASTWVGKLFAKLIACILGPIFIFWALKAVFSAREADREREEEIDKMAEAVRRSREKW